MGSFSFTSSLHSMRLSGVNSFSNESYELPRTHLAYCRFNGGSFDFPGDLSRRRYRQSVTVADARASVTNSVPVSEPRNGAYMVGDFMTRRENLHVVKATTTVDEALEMLVEKRITGFPVIDNDWNLVGVVSDYDLLALDSISGGGQGDANIFPDVDSSWKAFNRIQRLLIKTHGKVVGDLMTPAPIVVRETTNLEDAARLLLETKYRRLPVLDVNGKLIGLITRGNVVRAALQIKRANKHSS